MPPDYEISLSTAPSTRSFFGCIGDTTVNGQFQNFADSLDRPGASLASCPLGTPDVIPDHTESISTVEPATTTEPMVTTEASTSPEENVTEAEDSTTVVESTVVETSTTTGETADSADST